MKRYTSSYRYSIFPDIFFGSLYREDPKGEWVKWNDPLVQAAPDLLEALELYLSQDEIAQGYDAGIGGDAEVEARAAIAKAKGDING
jgi:hypothetical protein